LQRKRVRPVAKGSGGTVAAGISTSAWCSRVCRYVLTGGVAWVVDFVVFVAFVTPLGIVTAQLVARVAGALVAFLGHKFFVFQETQTEAAVLGGQALRYAALWVFSYGLSTLGLILLIEYLFLPEIPAKVLVEGCVVVLNYLIMRTLIFGRVATREVER
jgi:putative flippase GtrA